MRLSTFILFVFLFSSNALAQQFDANKNFDKAYSLLLDLRFEEASREIQAMRMANSQNLAAIYLEDLSDFLYIVVTEDEQQFKLRKEQKQARLDLIDNLPVKSPYKLLTEGEIHLHWAFSSMRFGEYFSAASGINKAFHLLERNIHKYPDFLPSYKSMGLLHTLIGTVPDNYKWATKLMGVDGTIEQGVSEMQMVLDRSSDKQEYANLREETLFLLTFLHLNLLNDAKSLEKFLELVQVETGPLMDFAQASLLKEQSRCGESISTLEKNESSREAFPYLNFLLGEMKLARMDNDADEPLKSYLKRFQGNSYAKSAKQKLAWHALLVKSDYEGYQSYISEVDEIGNTMLDEDKAAQKEFETGSVPNKTLLKARLQFDGGFYKEALKTLISSSSKDLKTQDDELEFTYRLGRIHHELENIQDAVSYYNITIKKGRDSKRYFAANSSLMLGLIYESEHQREKALQAFEACSTFSNSEYRNSINQKAKAGILRLAD